MMKFVLIVLTMTASLSGCAKAPINIVPAIPDYTKEQQNQAADEVEAKSCPMLTNFAIDYLVVRDQIRTAK